MALAATTVWEVRTDGNDDNGGGYKSDAGTTDYSQQAAAQLTVADGATAGIGVTTLTSVTGGFTAQMVGSIVHLYTGTNLEDGWYEITGYTDTNTVALDRAPDDGVGGVSSADVKVGGALATPGGAGKVLTDHGVNGMIAYVKSGTYVLANSTPATAGGPFHIPNGARLTIEGYGSSRGDLGTKPVLDAGSETSVSLWDSTNTGSSVPHRFINLKADGQDGANNVGFDLSGNIRDLAYLCEAVDCPTGFQIGRFYGCKASSCGTYGFNVVVMAHRCEAITCGIGFDGVLMTRSLAHDCTGDGFVLSSRGVAIGCTAWNNGGDGFDSDGSRNFLCLDCVAVNNGGKGFDDLLYWTLINCAAYNNTSGNKNDAGQIINFLTLTGDPFVDSGADDFRPDDTANEGAELRAAATVLPGQVNNLDIGAVQHADPAGGGGLLVHPGTSGGARG